ncbi:MAG: hypothetical protein Q8862_11360 [Bacteroidota bacterium]|nr:hypothetical protein [Bacteroidota bacterium]
MISRENYEMFFLDYMEGKLDEITQREVESFLAENPDLKEEFDNLDSFILPQDSFVFENKDSLRRECYDDVNVFEDTCVVLIEGDLTDQDEAEFERFLSLHPELKTEVSLFRQTRLVPDPLLSMPHRDSLYRRRISAITWYKAAAVAAVLTTIFAVTHLYEHHRDVSTENASIVASLKEQVRGEIKHPASVNSVNSNVRQGAPIQASVLFPKTSAGAAAISYGRLSGSTESVVIPSGGNVIVPKKSIIARSIQPINASQLTGFDLNDKTLADMEVDVLDDSGRTSPSIGKFLTDQLTPVEDMAMKVVHPSKIARLGLSVISVATGRIIDYQTNKEGEISSVSFDAKLVAFNIPVGKEK